MAAKPETTFIKSIHRKIPEVYTEKMNNPFLSGTADVWYSGDLGDLWVEYKFIAKIPRSLSVLPAITPLQKRWLDNRYNEGRNVAVVLGVPTGGVIYRNQEWSVPLTSTELNNRLMSKDEIAKWILSQVGKSPCQSQRQ